jgi:hypothetical protein
MKISDLKKLFVFGLVFISLFSCKEEEFYEKEFIDTLSDRYERENLPDDVLESPWEDSENNPDLDDYVPEEDHVSILDDDDAPVKIDDGGILIPPTNDDDDDDVVVVTPPVITPPSDDDDDDDDVVVVTPPVITPPSDDDDDDDDVVVVTPPVITPPSDDDDDDDVIIYPEVELQTASDSFRQSTNGSKLDILFVVDNSGSMADEQKALGANFKAFIKEFIQNDVDFKMAVTTTDTSRNNAGREYKDSMLRLTSERLKKNQSRFLKDFAKLVKVGTRGSGYERGIQASEVFSNRYANRWMRDDAYFVIVYMSDEEDQSRKAVKKQLKQIQKWKDNNGLIKAYSIVDMVPNRKRGPIYRGYARYKEMSDLTGGEVASIKSDFHTTLLKMGGQIADLTRQFPLSQIPFDASKVRIFIDDIETNEFTYDAVANSVKFDENAVPTAGSSIKVTYDVEK